MYCDIYDIIILKKSKRRRLQSQPHFEINKSISINHSVRKPDFFEIHDENAEHTMKTDKKYEICLVFYDFELNIINREFTPYNKPERQSILEDYFIWNDFEYFGLKTFWKLTKVISVIWNVYYN